MRCFEKIHISIPKIRYLHTKLILRHILSLLTLISFALVVLPAPSSTSPKYRSQVLFPHLTFQNTSFILRVTKI